MQVARVAIFDDQPTLSEDDDRRTASLRELVRNLPGFVAGFHLRDEDTGRMMSFTVWESDTEMEEAERIVSQRPAADQRGIRPTRVERWIIEGTF